MAEEKKAIPSTMRAIVFDRYAANNDEVPQVLRLAPEWKVPQPAAKQILVKVHAASINPVDYKMLKGIVAFMRPSPPTTVGFDLSGEVIAVGSGCNRLAVGDKVFGATAINQQGSFAEYVAGNEDNFSKKPDSITHAEAAALPVAANTAVQAFLDAAKLKKGERVLILAGAGGTGHLGIQLAKFWGASHVAATCSPHSVDFLKGLGADECIDYHNPKWAEGRSNSFDVVYDCVGGKEAWDDALAVLKPSSGRFLTIVGDKGNAAPSFGSVVKTIGGLINRKFWSNFGNPEYHLVMVQHKYQTTDRVAEAVSAGALKPFISKTYQLENFKEIFADIMSSRTRGKLVIDVSGQANTK